MKQKFNVLATIVFLTFFSVIISCNSTEENANKPKSDVEEHASIDKKNCDEVHWSHHKGDEGPEKWSHLCDGFSACGGTAQSPINFVTDSISSNSELSAIKFNYGKTTTDIINNLHTIQFNVSDSNSIELNGKDYKLVQFHYHALSEHTVNGKYFPIEVHFVHMHSDTDFAVVGLFIEEGAENKLFKNFLDKFPTTEGEYKSENIINLMSLLPDNKSYFSYNGSLTTPPCSEVVNWYVLQKTIFASKEQIEKFSKILDNNYRPIQALNGRKIYSFNE